MTTLLNIVKSVCRRIQLPEPSVVVGSTDPNIISIAEFVLQAGKDIRSAYEWPECEREYTFTLSSGTAAYPFPDDFNKVMFETMWNRSSYWPLIGPLTAAEWQYRKSGIGSTSPRQRFRVKGWGTNQFYLDPTPGADDADNTCVFNYQSLTWLRPTTVWSASLSVTALTYVYYEGNVYKKAAGSTTGSTPPTHTSGTVTDGGVTWTFVAYETPTADTDVPLFGDDDLIEGARWRFLASKGFDYGSIRSDNENSIRQAITMKRGARKLDMGGRQNLALIGPWNVPETGYGS